MDIIFLVTTETNEGDLTLKGSITETASSANLASDGSDDEFIIQDANGSNVARLTSDGDLYLKGHIYEGCRP